MSFRCSRDCDGPGCVACAKIERLQLDRGEPMREAPRWMVEMGRTSALVHTYLRRGEIDGFGPGLFLSMAYDLAAENIRLAKIATDAVSSQRVVVIRPNQHAPGDGL